MSSIRPKGRRTWWKIPAQTVPTFLWYVILAQPGSALACAACYGQSDSPMAKGFNWAIFSLLVVVVCVLGSIGAFIFFLARRAAALNAAAQKSAQPAAA